MKKHINFNRNLRRKLRVSRNIFGLVSKPRISVFRSNKFIYAQAIDDKNRKTIMTFSSDKLEKTGRKTDSSFLVGQNLAKLLIEKGITEGIFDRGKYSYKGRVKSVAEGMRKENFKI